MTGTVRRPAVAGYYYPSDCAPLAQDVDRFAARQSPLEPAYAVVVPHGSYRHAGRVLGAAFGRVRVPRRCIAIGPSHTGSWMPWSLMADGAYRTPLGDLPIDVHGAEALRARCPFLEPDAWSQRGEHAIEVLVPFLQRLGPRDLRIVPIIMGAEDPAQGRQLADALAQVVRMQEEPVLLIASSDLSHYAPRARAAAQDRGLIDAMCTLDAGAMVRRVQEDTILMCGTGAVACVLDAAAALGATRGTLAAYGTSAEAGGDPDSVTGYAGLIVT